jgi:hypothetical protein
MSFSLSLSLSLYLSLSLSLSLFLSLFLSFFYFVPIHYIGSREIMRLICGRKTTSIPFLFFFSLAGRVYARFLITFTVVCRAIPAGQPESCQLHSHILTF